MMGHHVMGISLAATATSSTARRISIGRSALRSSEHRPLATRFGADVRVSILCFRSWALWLLGYPEAALADAEQALKDAREISQATTLMFALFRTCLIEIFCGNYATATKQCDELIALATKKAPFTGRRIGTSMQGCLFALTGKASERSNASTPGSLHVGQQGSMFDAVIVIIFGKSLCGTRPIR